MKIRKIEALRGFVALYVVIYHFMGNRGLSQLPSIVKFPFRFGQEGVIIFFLISGFVIYLSCYKSASLNFGKYFVKRAVRIYPILIVAFILSILVTLSNHHPITATDYKALAGNFFMLQDSDLKPGIIVMPFLNNYPLWSLSYEWWFYMMFYPVFFYLLKRANKKLLANYLVLCISVVGWLLYQYQPNHLFLVLAYFSMWWTGVICAETYIEYKTFTLKNTIHAIIPLLVMTILMAIPVISLHHAGGKMLINSYPVITLRHYGFALLVIVGGLGWWQIKAAGFNTIFGWFEKLAPISYALYITHFIFVWANFPFFPNPLAQIAMKLILIFIVSYLLEMQMQPIINKFFFGKKKTTPGMDVPILN
ncbi:MAG: acyltransferase family protein [Sphingobacteriales bacterium]